MTNNVLIRHLPPELHEWIKEESNRNRITQNEFLLNLLHSSYEGLEQNPQLGLFNQFNGKNSISNGKQFFSFIDLFAGIGGFRIGLEKLGGTCRFSCEWDKHSQKTYNAWFGEVPEGDIREINSSDIPDHDILTAGFPCQPFSIAGVSKKNSLGLEHGFKDATQGTLFFHLARIIEEKRPPAVILENVKNLLSHDKKRTWGVIEKTLTSLGYTVFKKVIDAKYWVPQHRERVFIVCFDKKIFGENPPFEFPTIPKESKMKIKDILEKKPPAKYTLSDHLWTYLQDYAERHRRKGNGFGFGMTDVNGVSRTLSARYYKDGSEILIPQKKKNPRRLTPRETAKLMGFPEHLEIVVSDTQAYRQFGNAVVPKVVKEVAGQVIDVFGWRFAQTKNCCLLKGHTLSFKH